MNGFGLDLSEKFTLMPMDLNLFGGIQFDRLIVSVGLTARYDILKEYSRRWYVGAGPSLNYIQSDITLPSFFETIILGEFGEETQWAPGFQIVTGVDLFQDKRVGLNFEVRYEYFDVDDYTNFKISPEYQSYVDLYGSSISTGGNGGGVLFMIGVTFQNFPFGPYETKR